MRCHWRVSNRVLSTEYQAYLHAYLFIILYQRQFEIAVLVYYKNLWWPYIIVNTQVNQKKKKNQQKIHFLHIEKVNTSFSSTLAINEQDERIIT